MNKTRQWLDSDKGNIISHIVIYIVLTAFLGYALPAMIGGHNMICHLIRQASIIGCFFLIDGKSIVRDYSIHAKQEKTKYSVFGWFALLGVLILVWMFSESVGNYIAFKFPTDSNSVYMTMSGTDLVLYYISALTLGPVCEELLFRRCLFKRFRNKLPFWAAFLISTFCFTIVHGTLMHIPVTVLLSLLICVVYEGTGRFRFCLLLHWLFNFISLVYVTALGFGIVPAVIGYVLTAGVLVLMYIFRDKVFNEILTAKGVVDLERRLDEKRKNFGTKESDAGSDDADAE